MFKIPGYSNYTINEQGEVWSNTSSKFMTPVDKNGKGYLGFNLTDDTGKSKNVYLHRLLMLTFKPTNLPNMEVNHIDTNPSNNSLDNLEWVTRAQNQAHSYTHITGNGKSNFKPKQCGIPVSVIIEIQSKTDTMPVARWKGQAYTNTRGKFIQDLADEYRVSRPTMLRIARKEGVYNV